ncbi:hypothetical protein ACYSNO_03445 [Enterococcus sp. LJL98]
MQAKIIAQGKRFGVEMAVCVVDGVVYINGVKNDLYDWALEEQHPIAGSYDYVKADSMLNIANTLHFHFFDSAPSFVTIGTFELVPAEEKIEFVD